MDLQCISVRSVVDSATVFPRTLMVCPTFVRRLSVRRSDAGPGISGSDATLNPCWPFIRVCHFPFVRVYVTVWASVNAQGPHRYRQTRQSHTAQARGEDLKKIPRSVHLADAVD